MIAVLLAEWILRVECEDTIGRILGVAGHQLQLSHNTTNIVVPPTH